MEELKEMFREVIGIIGALVAMILIVAAIVGFGYVMDWLSKLS
jgi:Tfp pilus assembly protein PilO